VRRRTKRDIGLLLFVVLTVLGVIFVNDELRRGGFKEQMEKWIAQLEDERTDLDVLKWNLLRKTTGGRRTGANFDEALEELDGARVNVMGFMTPLYNFRDVHEFMLMPIPIECYFCQRPPLKDIIFVTMQGDKTVMMADEPVVINGTLKLNRDPGMSYFYNVDDALVGPAKKGARLTRRRTSQEAMQHAAANKRAEEERKKKLLEPEAPPVPTDGDATVQPPQGAPEGTRE